MEFIQKIITTYILKNHFISTIISEVYQYFLNMFAADTMYKVKKSFETFSKFYYINGIIIIITAFDIKK